MSVKGLPPAVRLDPLPLSSTSDYYQSPLSHTIAKAPKSVSATPPMSSNRTAHSQPVGLMPITPSSSRAHTPVQLLPLPHPLAFPQPKTASLGVTGLKKIKIESVNLEPLLPTKRENAPRVVARHAHNDQFSHQLPTPPLIQAPDTIHDGTCDRGRGPGPEFRYTAKTVVPLYLDHVQPLSLGPSQVDSREGFLKGRDIIERGRKQERGPGRSRTHERTRQRPTPYDPESKPRVTFKNAQQEQTGNKKYGRKANLNDIAAAAALAVNEADQVNALGSPHSLSSRPTPASTFSSSPTLPEVMAPRQQNDHLHSRGMDDPQIRSSRIIHDAVDGMIKLISCQSQTQMAHDLSYERQQCQKLYVDLQRERAALALLKAEMQKDEGQLQQERQKLRGQAEKEISAENEKLKARIVQLEAAVNDLRTRGV